MLISDLNLKSETADDDAYAVDVATGNGTDTQKILFSTIRESIKTALLFRNLTAITSPGNGDAIAVDPESGDMKKVTVANLGKKITEDAEPAFTSGDASSPTGWTDVTVVQSGTALKTILTRITTMMKNVRWIYSRLGTADISNIGDGTITEAISVIFSSISDRVVRSNVASDDVNNVKLRSLITLPGGKSYIIIVGRFSYTWENCASMYIITTSSSDSTAIYGRTVIAEGSDSHTIKVSSAGAMVSSGTGSYTFSITAIAI